MSNYFSYSKVGTYQNCPLSYDLSYERKIKLPREFNYDVAKGNIFHTYAEVYNGDGRTSLARAFNEAPDLTKEQKDKLTFEQKQTIINACKEFDIFYESFLKSKPQEFVKKEYNIKTTFDIQMFKYTFTGYVDLAILNPDEPIILDYKTPKSANTELYKKQIYIYIYFVSSILKIPVEKFKGYVFFPFATDVSGEKRLKSIKVSEDKVKAAISELFTSISEINSTNRSKEARINFLCNYCSYCGIEEYCPLSVIAGAKKGVNNA